jgi:hypothetical protein
MLGGSMLAVAGGWGWLMGAPYKMVKTGNEKAGPAAPTPQTESTISTDTKLNRP